MTSKIDLSDVTFLIPIRIDSIDRLENLVAIISFLNEQFMTNIQLLEASSFNNGILSELLPKNVKIEFIEDHDPVFHRTRHINNLLKSTNTSIVSVWDSDVLVAKKQIEQSVELIRNKKADFVLPYNGNFLDTSKIIREQFLQDKDLSILENNEKKMNSLYGLDSIGGGFFANRISYIESGMENENFYGWGHEDGERVNRWEILGYKFTKINGSMFNFLRRYRATFGVQLSMAIH